jgi:hypothetical protein
MTQHPRAVVPQMRVFRCPKCGTLQDAPKTKGRTHPGHIKTFWCYVCQTDTDQVQEE